MFLQVLFFKYIFYSYLLFLVSDSTHQKLLEIEEKKLAMQREHLDTAKKEIDLFKEYIYFIKYEESKQRDKRGFFG